MQEREPKIIVLDPQRGASVRGKLVDKAEKTGIVAGFGPELFCFDSQAVAFSKSDSPMMFCSVLAAYVKIYFGSETMESKRQLICQFVIVGGQNYISGDEADPFRNGTAGDLKQSYPFFWHSLHPGRSR
jgi:hypothetical protein